MFGFLGVCVCVCFMSLLLFPSWEGYERVGGVALWCHLPLCVCVHARVLRLHRLVLTLTLKLPS